MRSTVVLLTATLAAILLIGVGQGPAHADVTAVKGSAFGYSCTVSVFGNSCTPPGPTPTVTLAPDASNSPLTASAASASASAGPATIFSSGRLDISTQGTLGSTGSVTSSTNIANVNASGQENFTATNLASSCAASETAVSNGSTTITNGTLVTDNGDDDPTNTIPDHPPVSVTLPTNPAPNKSYDGHIHIGNTTDTFRYVFNEQTLNADGSITVNAAHQYLLGPAAIGDLIIGRSVCGVTGTTPPPDTTAPKVRRVVPAENATGIGPGANVSTIFSEAMRAGSINTNTVKIFRAGTTTPIGAVVSYDASTKKATLNPNANLQRGTRYKAVVTTGAKDLAGNRLDQNAALSGLQQKVWFFTVRK